MKVKKVMCLQIKNPLFLEVFLVFLNQVFPCFHCFSETSPTQILSNISYISFSWKGVSNITYLSHLPISAFNT